MDSDPIPKIHFGSHSALMADGAFLFQIGKFYNAMNRQLSSAEMRQLPAFLTDKK